ncbi:uncharacterized protein BDW47DRAFT_114205 [Aspergillus candidus]|uniref:Secreted protein n=1 Tax=Aspergillus candidus TaxID=41067 RepID=A0A2I2EY76_ASPCN|nr:hypothetical protein BDW47DRAFT_114205 [Aspergillus candidus]PLB33320.1 hypothetical protein BDW47DRAFT_114205 [Aspergillus candidus]
MTLSFLFHCLSFSFLFFTHTHTHILSLSLSFLLTYDLNDPNNRSHSRQERYPRIGLLPFPSFPSIPEGTHTYIHTQSILAFVLTFSLDSTE